MKKLLMCALILCAVFLSPAVEPEKIDPRKAALQIGFYGTNFYTLGEMTDFSFCTIGAGVGFEYRLPFIPFLGVSFRAETEFVVETSLRVDQWYTFSAAAGFWTDFPFGNSFSFRPELAYGALLNVVKSPESIIDGLHIDQMLLFAASFRYWPFPASLRNPSIELAPQYTLALENEDLVHYIGFRFGVYYGL